MSRDLSVVALGVLLAALIVWFMQVNSVAINGSEAQAAWVVRDHPMPNADLAGRIRHDLESLLDRLDQQSQPPLYFIVLDSWQIVTGTTHMIPARILSLLFGVAAALIGGLITAGGRMRTAWHALSSFVLALMLMILLAPALRADVYSLTALTAILAFWRLMRLRESTSLLRTLLYLITLILALLSAHVALVLIPLHGAAALMRGQWRRVLPVMGLALLPYAAWLIYAGQGLDDVLLNWQSIRLMLFVVIVSVVPAMLAFVQSIPNIPRLLPGAVSLLGVLVIAWLLQLPGQPEYIDDLLTDRDPVDPVIYDFPPDHPLNYINTKPETQLTAGLSIDLGWRDFSPDELDTVIESVTGAETIWLMLPEDASAWDHLVAMLSNDRDVGYDRREAGFRFVQLDRS